MHPSLRGGVSFVIDLPDLGGAKKIKALGIPVRTLMSFGDIETDGGGVSIWRRVLAQSGY